MRRGSSSLLLFTLFLFVETMLVSCVAEIAQLVEHNLAKVGVAGPSPVFRSSLFQNSQFYSRLFIFKVGSFIPTLIRLV